MGFQAPKTFQVENKVVGGILYSHQIILSLTGQEGQHRLRKSTLLSIFFVCFLEDRNVHRR